MDKKQFEHIRENGLKGLAEKHLLKGLNSVRLILPFCHNMELTNEWESISKDYGIMLDFIRQGGTDPQREEIHRKLLLRCFQLIESCTWDYRIQNKTDIFADIYLKLKEKGYDFRTLAGEIRILQDRLSANGGHAPSAAVNDTVESDRRTLYELYDCLFQFFWTSPQQNADNVKEWKAFLEEQDENIRAMLVCGIMLGNLDFFDPQKTLLLLYFCKSRELKVRVRALTAIVQTCMQYGARLAYYPDVYQGISMLVSDPQIQPELLLLQKQFMISLEVVKIEKILKEKIYPEIMKSNLYRNKSMEPKNEKEEELARTLEEGPNAEWDELYSNSRLTGHMHEIFEMGQEGADINLGTFSGLKSFTFFWNIAHWFTLFDENHPEIHKEYSTYGKNSPIRTLMSGAKFCDSDKYSLCLMVRQLTSEQRETMLSQIGSQMEGVEEMVKEAVSGQDKVKEQYRSYLQDLYRFYHLNPQKTLFANPFNTKLLFSAYPLISNLLASPGYKMNMASFLIKKEFFQEAANYLDEILKEETATAEMLQKLAFCHQRLSNPGKAIYYYQQADLLLPDNEWILKQMYLCYSALGKYDQKLAMLKRLEAINPDNAKTIIEIGLCLMKLERHEEALQYFFEGEYKGSLPLPCWRAIAWCYFKSRKLEQAYKYYQKIINQGSPIWEDLLNAGHTAFCMHNTSLAAGHYTDFSHLYDKENQNNDDAPSSEDIFDEDKNELLDQGISETDITLMRDIIFRRFYQ